MTPSAGSAERLRRRCHVALDGEHAEKRRHFRLAQLERMALAMKADEPAGPVPVRLLRSPAVVPRPDLLAKALDQTFLLSIRRRTALQRRIRSLTHLASANNPR
jgi:hypothetical protein